MVNARITKLKYSPRGEYKIKDLEINGEKVPVVSDMTKNADGAITDLYINEVKQNLGSLSADTTVPVLLCTSSDSENGIVFIFKADGTIIDDVADLADAETAIFIYSTGYIGYSILSDEEFTAKYGLELPPFITSVTIENDEENKVLTFDNGHADEFTYSDFENLTVFKLCAMGRGHNN